MKRGLLVVCCLTALFAQTPGRGAPAVAPVDRAFLPSAAGGELWLLLTSLGALGIEVDPGPDGVFLRGRAGPQVLPPARLRDTAHGPALPLSLVQAQAGVRALALGERVYVFAPPAHLHEILPVEQGVRLTFSGFVSYAAVREAGASGDAGALTLTFLNVQTLLPDGARRWGDGPTVELASDATQRRLTVRFTGWSQPDIVPRSGPDGFFVEVTGRPAESALSAGSALSAESGPPPAGYSAARVPTAAGPADAHVLRVPDFSEKYRLAPLLPAAGVGALVPLAELARGRAAAAAINANFFDPATGMPIGLLVSDGDLVQEDYARRGALGVDVFGGLHFLRSAADAELVLFGETRRLNGVNRAPRADELVALTPQFRQVLAFAEPVTAARVVDGRVSAVRPLETLQPDGRARWLLASGARQAELAALHPGDPAALRFVLDPAPRWPLRYAVGAGPLLIQDGRVVLDPAAEAFSVAFAAARAARSALGVTADGSLLLAVVEQGAHSAGMTLAELAVWLRSLGATDALSMDGGSSAALGFREGVRWRAFGGQRPVAVGLGLIPR